MSIANAGILFAGPIRIDVYDEAGQPGGFSDEINATKLEVVANKNEVSRTISSHVNYGQSTGTVVVPEPTTMTLACDQLSAPIWQLAFLATLEDYSQGSGSVAAASATARLDRWVKFSAFENFTAGTELVQDVTDTNTYALNTDYLVDYDLGMIKALSTGAIAEGAVLHVSMDYLAESGTQINAGVRSSIIVAIRGKGRNLETGEAVRIDIPKAVLSPTGGVDMMAREHWVPEFGGNVDLKSGENSLYTMRVI